MAFLFPSLSIPHSRHSHQSYHSRKPTLKRFRTPSSSLSSQTTSASFQTIINPVTPTTSQPLKLFPLPTTTNPSTTKPTLTPHPTRPQRRPHGYWNDLANVQEQLEQVNAQLGRPRQRIIPRLSEIAALGRGDLVAALGKHGGVKKVALALRWRCAGSKRLQRRDSDNANALAKSKAKRSPFPRRPIAYWRDRARVEAEIGAFVAEYGTIGVLPTRAQFYSFGRADLVQAAARHGGLGDIGRGMGLRCRGRPRKRGFWKDFDPLRKELIAFSKQFCPGRMPTADELSAKGLSAVANAIPPHGGFRMVAEKCGLRRSGKGNQGAPNVWNKQRLRKELLTFVQVQDLQQSIMPTESQLRKHGRNDLSYAIKKFGGFAVVAEIVGLRKKEKGPFQKGKLSNTSR